jgi:CcmD family protein
MNEIIDGTIEGGWEFVYAAYIVTWVFLGGYGLSLWKRSRS